MKLIRKGKAKDIYEKDDRTLIFHFTDRVSAFDVIMEDQIPYKGKVLCDFAVFWFSRLKIENHFIERIDVDKILVKKLNMIPIECIVRGYLYGSMYSRLISNQLDISEFPFASKNINPVLASKLPFLVFDPTTKSEEHDSPIVKDQVLKQKIITEVEYLKLKSESLDLYNQMSKILLEANFILADTKFEFGKDPTTNSISLA
ncbi:MAG: phosphoribosylaminoimidazolesuccinocarboxamide synthase, partial [Thermoproteota archaeon]|nr:phosphoribosylaminoimidazolesuccinocarboxamide synthase [Thermoproteota archaeon]